MKTKHLFLVVVITILLGATMPVQAQNNVQLRSKVDSVSYAIGVSQTKGFLSYLQDEKKVNLKYLDDFAKGMRQIAVSNLSGDRKVAYVTGKEIRALLEGKIPAVNQIVFGENTTRTISSDLYFEGFLSIITGKGAHMTYDKGVEVVNRLCREFEIEAVTSTTPAAPGSSSYLVPIPNGIFGKVPVNAFNAAWELWENLKDKELSKQICERHRILFRMEAEPLVGKVIPTEATAESTVRIIEPFKIVGYDINPHDFSILPTLTIKGKIDVSPSVGRKRLALMTGGEDAIEIIFSDHSTWWGDDNDKTVTARIGFIETEAGIMSRMKKIIIIKGNETESEISKEMRKQATEELRWMHKTRKGKFKLETQDTPPTTVTETSSHLVFMGIPMDCTLKKFMEKLRSKGFVGEYIKGVDPDMVPYKMEMRGNYQGNPVILTFMVTPKTRLVRSVTMKLDNSGLSESKVNAIYQQWKKTLASKVGPVMIYRNKNDYSESCLADIPVEVGTVSFTFGYTPKGSLKTDPYLFVTYNDTQNFNLAVSEDNMGGNADDEEEPTPNNDENGGGGTEPPVGPEPWKPSPPETYEGRDSLRANLIFVTPGYDNDRIKEPPTTDDDGGKDPPAPHQHNFVTTISFGTPREVKKKKPVEFDFPRYVVLNNGGNDHIFNKVASDLGDNLYIGQFLIDVTTIADAERCVAHLNDSLRKAGAGVVLRLPTKKEMSKILEDTSYEGVEDDLETFFNPEVYSLMLVMEYNKDRTGTVVVPDHVSVTETHTQKCSSCGEVRSTFSFERQFRSMIQCQSYIRRKQNK